MAKIVVFVIILLFQFIFTTSAQDNLSCSFGQRNDGYTCFLSIINPEGFDNFTSINGEHLQGMSNDNVNSILIGNNGYSTNIPSIICETFRNIETFNFEFNIIENISENSFKNCKSLKAVTLAYNNVREISENAFRENQQIETVDFSNNRLRQIPKNLFTPTNKLRAASFGNNYLRIIDSDIFGDQPQMESIGLMANLIEAVDERILDRTSVSYIGLVENICANSFLFDNSVGRTEMRQAFKACFNHFENGIEPTPSPRLHCNYFLQSDRYACTLLLENQHGWDNFTEISGFHLQNFNDDNVKFVWISDKSVATVLPSLVCEKYKNIEEIGVWNTEIEEITSYTFRSCQKLVDLNLRSNKIKRFAPDAFRQNTILQNVDLSDNYLEDLPANLFTSTRSLGDVRLRGNSLSVLHSDTFGEQGNVISIVADRNNIIAVDERILDLTSVPYLSLFENVCANDISIDHTVEKEQMRKDFRECFDNYKGREEQSHRVQCEYIHHLLGYSCIPQITNPNGFDNFTHIEGIHTRGYGDEDVIIMFPNSMLNSPIFPSIICQKFINMELIIYSNNIIEEITDTSFRGCSKLREVSFLNNRINRITPNAFQYNAILSNVDFASNFIKEIPRNLFRSTRSLSRVNFVRNNLTVIHSDIFGEQPNLRSLAFGQNMINAVDEKILVITNVSEIELVGNVCADRLISDNSSGRVIFREEFRRCFDNYKELEVSTNKVQCSFIHHALGYSCLLQITNPNGWDNFTHIESSHLQGYGDEDVVIMLPNGMSNSPIFPSIICQTFINMELIIYANSIIVEITDSSFSGCSKLKEILFHNNRINRISPNAFKGNIALSNVNFASNFIEELPKNLFTSTKSLITVNFSWNNLTVIHSDIFGEQPSLRMLLIARNMINAVDEKILAITNVSEIELVGNVCTDRLVSDNSTGRVMFREVFRTCFDNYKELEASADKVQCSYINHLHGYTCILLIVNPNGLDNFTFIDGDHTLGSNHDDVLRITSNALSNATLFPSIICSEFENLEFIGFVNNRIEEITENTFKRCSKLKEVNFLNNRIKKISQNAFQMNKILSTVDFSSNNIEELPKNLFTPTKSLVRLDLARNNLRIIHSDTIGDQPTLKTIFIHTNNIIAIDERILSKTSLSTIDFTDIACASGYLVDNTIGKVGIHEKLRNCFRIFREIEGLEPPAIEIFGYLSVDSTNILA